MLPIVSIGALLVIAGFLWTAHTAIFRGELSEPHATAGEKGGVTLEPRQRGLRFLGLRANWPALAMMVVGSLMLLLGAAF
jgi:hypothetical protein